MNKQKFETTLAGSLPKPAWLADPGEVWPTWRLSGDALAQGKLDATLMWLKQQEDLGLDIVTDGEQSRIHFVHGFLEAVDGVDSINKIRAPIRNGRSIQTVPVVKGAISLRGRVHEQEARLVRAHTTRKVKYTLPGPMTCVDTSADVYYKNREKLAMDFARLLNLEARGLEADGVDIIQFDEPAFNVYMDDAASWGIEALHVAAEGLACKTAVHICYGYGSDVNANWKASLGSEWRQYEKVFPALAKSRIDQVSLECARSHVPIEFLGLLAGKDLMVGVIDVQDETVETPEEVAATIKRALQYVKPEHLFPCTNCGMSPTPRPVALAKMRALVAGSRLACEAL